MEANHQVDIAVVGAGPSGMACGIEAGKRGYSYVVLEKGCLVNSIYHYPPDMVFFTTAELLEIGNVPMTVSTDKPRRVDGLVYYRRVADVWKLHLRDYTRVVSIDGKKDDFVLRTRTEQPAKEGREEVFRARRVVLALGYYDHPNYLGIPGEDLPNVSHYFTDVHPFFHKKVAVIGGRNSAAEAALLLYRSGAEVTLIHRGLELGSSIKYWVRPDIENRIKRKEIQALLGSTVTRIEPSRVWVRNGDGRETALESDFVFALTGYHPDVEFLESAGIQVDPVTLRPEHNPETLETNRSGVYVAGGMVCGRETNKIFIENGRFHGEQIMSSPGFDLTAKG
jgi:thioredoxin reductase (NADPH)